MHDPLIRMKISEKRENGTLFRDFGMAGVMTYLSFLERHGKKAVCPYDFKMEDPYKCLDCIFSIEKVELGDSKGRLDHNIYSASGDCLKMVSRYSVFCSINGSAEKELKFDTDDPRIFNKGKEMEVYPLGKGVFKC
jgi:hypothetical protein